MVQQWPRQATARLKLARYWAAECGLDTAHTLRGLECGLRFRQMGGYHEDASTGLCVPRGLVAVCPATVPPGALLLLYMHIRIGFAASAAAAVQDCILQGGAPGSLAAAACAQAVWQNGGSPLIATVQKIVQHPSLVGFLRRVSCYLYRTHPDVLHVDTAIESAMARTLVVSTESMHLGVVHAVAHGGIKCFTGPKARCSYVAVYPGGDGLRMSWVNHAVLLLMLVFTSHGHELPAVAAELKDALAPTGRPLLAEVLAAVAERAPAAAQH